VAPREWQEAKIDLPAAEKKSQGSGGVGWNLARYYSLVDTQMVNTRNLFYGLRAEATIGDNPDIHMLLLRGGLPPRHGVGTRLPRLQYRDCGHI